MVEEREVWVAIPLDRIDPIVARAFGLVTAVRVPRLEHCVTDGDRAAGPLGSYDEACQYEHHLNDL